MNKEDIIYEIRRTASQNNGTPLGKQRFLQETGIKETDWIGKYWVKWSDAIREAGYRPNEMNEALSDNYLLEKYVTFAKEISHVPNTAELRMHARDNTNFPSHNTFSKYGNKNNLVLKAIKFCEANISFSEVIPILIAARKKEHQDIAENENFSEDGYVYLLKFGEEYKIGSSNNVERRFRELKTQMPYEGKIIHTIKTGDPNGIELYWHSYFKEKRLKGEWFKLSCKDIAYFKKRKLM